MQSETISPRPTSVRTRESLFNDGSYLDWAAILGGAVLSLAISSLLISFGASLGLSLTSPYRGEGVSASWVAIAAGIWFVWVMVTSFSVGGYLTGRMRRHAGDALPDEVELRDGANGLLVWATGALFGIFLAASGVSGMIGVGTSAIGSAAGTIGQVAEDVASEDYFASLMLRSGADEPDVAAPTGDAVNSGGDTDASTQTLDQSGRDATRTRGASARVLQEITGIIARSAESGNMPERDRIYLARLVAANSDLDQASARSRVDEVSAEIVELRETALAAVEQARVAGVVFGFIVASTLLIGALAAYFSAALGGRHRDEGLGLDSLTTRR